MKDVFILKLKFLKIFKKFFCKLRAGECSSLRVPLGRRLEKLKIFPPQLSLRVRYYIYLQVTTSLPGKLRYPMREPRTLVLLNGHLVTIDEYREWIEDQQN